MPKLVRVSMLYVGFTLFGIGLGYLGARLLKLPANRAIPLTPKDPIKKLVYYAQITDQPSTTVVRPLAHPGTVLKWRADTQFNVQFLTNTNPCDPSQGQAYPKGSPSPIGYFYTSSQNKPNNPWVAQCTVVKPENLQDKDGYGFGLQNTKEPQFVEPRKFPVTPCSGCFIDQGGDDD